MSEESSVTALTFASSRWDCWRLPKPSEPGLPSTAGPEAAVSRKRLSPIGLVDEARELELPKILRRRLAGKRCLDLARRRDGDTLGGLRNGDARLDEVAVAGDELALRVEIEGAVAAIGVLPSGI